ncbi:ATP-binding protein [Patescibacteria group bacterium]|nr:ATP-binding protein [Patescibacteria group bacterium]MBU1663232.1 ATP-binding protein [Patescibacteria group bacterium]MBU1934365.1 ATP-binding protein [Patescibacteria group bacterium]MBU2008067.1 ATP-binding protein [Patescibacteria group bacterium]MBU2233888.1 ATP-binding protein [Patescibacteria group bacterium]
MYIKRIAEKFLIQATKNKKILIILGARQVGKTTLIKHFLTNKNAVFLNLDIEVDKNKFLAISMLEPSQAIKALGQPRYLIIDEAQRLKNTGQIIKAWYDASVNSKIILLGSSSLNLINQSAESLTGRNEKLFLSPLLFKEIITNQSWYSTVYKKDILNKSFREQINSLLLYSLVFGNYPEIIHSTDKQQYLLNLVSDYLLKDILQLGLIKTPNLIKKLLMMLAHQIGAEVSVNELANNLGMNKITVNKYLDLLEETFVIFRLPSYSTNPRKEISKSHKIYFYDTGIRNAILNEFSLNPLRSDIGQLWENWVVAEFMKNNLLFGQKQNLYFWRSRAKSEVDLVVKQGEKISAYEIKWKKKNINERAFENQYKVKVQIINSDNPLFL